MEYYIDTEDSTLEKKYTNKFLARHTGSLSLSLNTKIYGVFPVGILQLESFRHIITPSISYSWRPDFSEHFYGYDLGYFQLINGELKDKFAGSMAGNTQTQKQKTMGISLNNQFQAKIMNNDKQYFTE